MDKICIGCGKTFICPKGENGSYTRKTCSDACAKTSRAKNNIWTKKQRKHMSEVSKENKSYMFMHTPEAKEKRARATSKVKFGKQNNKLRGRPHNICVFISPNGVEYNTCNIAEFVRDNRELFKSEDAEWVSKKKTGSADKRARAYHGLRSLSSGARGTWKGWTIKSKNGYEFGSYSCLD